MTGKAAAATSTGRGEKPRSDDPLRYATPDELDNFAAELATLVSTTATVDKSLLLLFRKASVVLQNRQDVDGTVSLTSDERFMLRNEIKRGLWHSSPTFRITVLGLCFAALSQGWVQSAIGGAELAWYASSNIHGRGAVSKHIGLSPTAINKAVYLITTFCGYWLLGRLQNTRFGRRHSVFYLGLIRIASLLHASLAQTQMRLICCKALAGLASGLETSAVTMYIAEISPAHARRAIVAYWHFFVALGILIGLTTNVFFGASGLLVDSMCIQALWLLSSTCIVAQSPRSLLKQLRYREAYMALCSLRETHLQAAVEILSVRTQSRIKVPALSSRHRYVEKESSSRMSGRNKRDNVTYVNSVRTQSRYRKSNHHSWFGLFAAVVWTVNVLLTNLLLRCSSAVFKGTDVYRKLTDLLPLNDSNTPANSNRRLNPWYLALVVLMYGDLAIIVMGIVEKYVLPAVMSLFMLGALLTALLTSLGVSHTKKSVPRTQKFLQAVVPFVFPAAVFSLNVPRAYRTIVSSFLKDYKSRFESNSAYGSWYLSIRNSTRLLLPKMTWLGTKAKHDGDRKEYFWRWNRAWDTSDVSQVDKAKCVTWTCTCGETLFDYYTELKRGALEQLQQLLRDGHSRPTDERHQSWTGTLFSGILRSNAIVNSGEHSRQPGGRLTGTTGSGNDASTSGSEILKSSSQNENDGSLSPATTVHTAESAGPGRPRPNNSYLLLCIPEKYSGLKPHQQQIAQSNRQQVHTHQVSNDRELFRLLQQTYKSIRKTRLVQFWPRTVVRVSLAYFLVDLEKYVQLRHYGCQAAQPDCRCIPPTGNVEYHCDPRDPPYRPPIGMNYLTHYFQHPDCIQSDNLRVILNQVPKRLSECIATSGDSRIEAWGLEFEEGWHRGRLQRAFAWLVLTGSVMFFILWWVLKHDVQGASGVASFCVGSLALLGYLVSSDERMAS